MDVTTIASSTTVQGTAGVASVATPATGLPQSNDASKSSATTASPDPTPNQISKAVNQINAAFTQNNQAIFAKYEKDPATGIEVVQFVDQDNGQVVSQVPSKVALAIAQSIQDLSAPKGQLVNAQA